MTPSRPDVGDEADQPVKPIAWAAFAPNGNVRLWTADRDQATRIADYSGLALEPLYRRADLDAAVAACLERDPEAAKLCILRHDAVRALEAWDSTPLPKAGDGMMQERMEGLRASLADLGA